MMNNYKVKAFVALQGNRMPWEYISLSKEIEDLGFDRIFVYDDLLDSPAWAILSLIAEHTKKIEIGPCLVSGLYSHPIRIARNAIFTNELSKDRLVLGIGKGAFYDFIGKEYPETMTKEVCIETVDLIKKLLLGLKSGHKGKYFEVIENIKLHDYNKARSIPLILGSFDKEMAFFAGQICDEFQTGEVWNTSFLKKMYSKLQEGSKLSKRNTPSFSIGGITCISNDRKQAYDIARPLVARYLPYLNNIVKDDSFILSKEELEKLKYYMNQNDIKKATSMLTDEVVDFCALVGTPDDVIPKLKHILDEIHIYGISFGPPYGTYDTISENLKFIKNEVMSKLT